MDRDIKNKEFVGIIRKVYSGNKYGWYEVEIPELLPGQTLTVYDGSQKHALDDKNGSYFPLLEGQTVVIKFKSNNINSGYIDRKYEGNVFKSGNSGAINKFKYIIVKTPKNHNIGVDEEKNTIEILYSGGKSGVKFTNDGIQICTNGKVEISAQDVIDIKSSTNVFIHSGAPSCSAAGVSNQILKSIVSQIDYYPDSNISLLSTSLIKSLDTILNENISATATENSNSGKNKAEIKNNLYNTYSKFENKVNVITKSGQDYIEISQSKYNEIKNNLNDKLNILKKIVESIETNSSATNSAPQSVNEFLSYVKYVYNNLTGTTYFQLTAEEITTIEEKYPQLISFLNKNVIDTLDNTLQGINSYYSKTVPQLTNISTSNKESLNYYTDYLSEMVPNSLTGFQKKFINIETEISTKILDKLNNSLSEDKIVTCDDNRKIIEYLKSLNLICSDLGKYINRINDISSGAKIVSSKLETKNPNSLISKAFTTLSNTVSGLVDSVKTELTNIANGINDILLNDENLSVSDKKGRALYFRRHIKDIITEILNFRNNNYKPVVKNIQLAYKIETRNVICQILNSLSNITFDLNFELDIYFLEWLQKFKDDTRNIFSTTISDAYSDVCIYFNPCGESIFTYDLQVVVPETDIQTLLNSRNSEMLQLLNNIANLSDVLSNIKKDISKMMVVIVGLYINLGALFKSLLNFTNSMEFEECLTSNLKNLSELTQREISTLLTS